MLLGTEAMSSDSGTSDRVSRRRSSEIASFQLAIRKKAVRLTITCHSALAQSRRRRGARDSPDGGVLVLDEVPEDSGLVRVGEAAVGLI